MSQKVLGLDLIWLLRSFLREDDILALRDSLRAYKEMTNLSN